MSLYTFSKQDQRAVLKPISGLHMEESTDTTLLAQMGGISEAEVVKRLANDNLAFVAFLHKAPAAFGWMARGKAIIGELNHDFVLPLHNRYLWNFRTMPSFRGLGIYPALLQYIMQYEGKEAERLWIIHAPENKASLNGIRKAGFRYVGKLYTKGNGSAGFEAALLTDDEQHLISAMGFDCSQEAATTCWNCSSPYLKKKTETCCCIDADVVCSAHQLPTA